MLSNPPTQDKLFRKAKGGDSGALHDLLESVRSELYDYLMRMTGQVTRSAETVDEVYLSLTDEVLAPVARFADLKLVLFTTARKFNADIWNADTSRLSNGALEGPVEAADVTEKLLRERQTQRNLDRALRSLPGPEREAAILRSRYHFDGPECAQIMSVPQRDVDARTRTAIARVGAECQGMVTPVETLLYRLPAHPPPARSIHGTMNLSEVMQGLRTRPVGIWSPLRLAFVGVLGAAGLALYLKPQLWAKLVSFAKELVR